MSNAKEQKPDPAGGHNSQVTIVINGRPVQVSEKELSFEQIVVLSGLPSDDQTIFTITFRRGEGSKPEGTLVAGQSVKIKEGMIFNVTPTNRS